MWVSSAVSSLGNKYRLEQATFSSKKQMIELLITSGEEPMRKMIMREIPVRHAWIICTSFMQWKALLTVPNAVAVKIHDLIICR